MIRRLLAAALAAMLLALPMGAFAAEGAVYEVFVASFYDGNGDGIGDLAGLTEKIPYVAGLGVGGIWMMPISPSPSYHKYDVTDYMAVDPAYGTLEDFDALVEACHASGLSVILDLVINHTSREHPWFASACASIGVEPCGQETCACKPLCREHNPYVNYYTFTHDSSMHAVSGTDWYYLGNFGDHMPDLNLENPDVRGEIADILEFWLKRGADGFRLDAVTSYCEGNTAKNVQVLAWLRETVKRIEPDAYLVGEAWTDEASILSLYASGVDSLFAFPFAGPTGKLVADLRNEDGAGYARALEAWYSAVEKANPEAKNAPFLSNHDMARMAGTLRFDAQAEKLAAAAYLLLPGMPYLYYGEELGMSGSGADENKRLPMLWSAMNDDGTCLPPANADQSQRQKQGVAEQDAQADSLLNCYREILHLRNALPVFQHGAVQAADLGQDALCGYILSDEHMRVLVAHNFSREEISCLVQGEMLKVLGEGELVGDMLTLGGLSSAVIQLK